MPILFPARSLQLMDIHHGLASPLETILSARYDSFLVGAGDLPSLIHALTKQATQAVVWQWVESGAPAFQGLQSGLGVWQTRWLCTSSPSSPDIAPNNPLLEANAMLHQAPLLQALEQWRLQIRQSGSCQLRNWQVRPAEQRLIPFHAAIWDLQFELRVG